MPSPSRIPARPRTSAMSPLATSLPASLVGTPCKGPSLPRAWDHPLIRRALADVRDSTNVSSPSAEASHLEPPTNLHSSLRAMPVSAPGPAAAATLPKETQRALPRPRRQLPPTPTDENAPPGIASDTPSRARMHTPAVLEPKVAPMSRSPKKVFCASQSVKSRLQLAFIGDGFVVPRSTGGETGRQCIDASVHHSSSIVIPAQARTGPCLLAPTPSFTAAHSPLRPRKDGRRRKRRGWLFGGEERAGPAPARTSLMLATSSFVRLGDLGSTASFASMCSFRRRGREKEAVGAVQLTASASASAGVGEEAKLDTSADQRDADRISETPSIFRDVLDIREKDAGDARKKDEEDVKTAVGLPEDMLVTLTELEVIAGMVMSLPPPQQAMMPFASQDATESQAQVGLTGTGSETSGSPVTPTNSTPLQAAGVPGICQPAQVSVGGSDSIVLRPPRLSEGSNASQLAKTPSPVDSRLPRVGRMTIGRTVSSPVSASSAAPKSRPAVVPSRAFSGETKMGSVIDSSYIKPGGQTTPRTPVVPASGSRKPSAARPRPAVAVGALRTKTPVGTFIGLPGRPVTPCATASRTPRTPAFALGLSRKEPAINPAIKPRMSEPVVPVASALRNVSPVTPISKIARRTARHSEVTSSRR